MCFRMELAPDPEVMARGTGVGLIHVLQVLIPILTNHTFLLHLFTLILATRLSNIRIPPSALALPVATHSSPRLALLDARALFLHDGSRFALYSTCSIVATTVELKALIPLVAGITVPVADTRRGRAGPREKGSRASLPLAARRSRDGAFRLMRPPMAGWTGGGGGEGGGRGDCMACRALGVTTPGGGGGAGGATTK
jgi:hypothetical protein